MTTLKLDKSNLRDRVFKPLKQLGMVDMLGEDQFTFRSPIYRFIDVFLHIGEQADLDFKDGTEASGKVAFDLPESPDQGA